MELRVLKQFSHFNLGAFVSGEKIEVPDTYAEHLIEIGVAEKTDPEVFEKVDENVDKRPRSRKSATS